MSLRTSACSAALTAQMTSRKYKSSSVLWAISPVLWSARGDHGLVMHCAYSKRQTRCLQRRGGTRIQRQYCLAEMQKKPILREPGRLMWRAVPASQWSCENPELRQATLHAFSAKPDVPWERGTFRPPVGMHASGGALKLGWRSMATH